jgi:hypothetical protein
MDDLAHQDIVFNLRTLLGRLLSGTSYRVAHEMRLQIGNRIRYPDVVVFAEPVEQMTRALNDAVAIFEVLSDDTATTIVSSSSSTTQMFRQRVATCCWNRLLSRQRCSSAKLAACG